MSNKQNSNETNKMGLWILVDALLLLAIVVLIAFVVSQTKANGKNNPSVTLPPVPTKAPSNTATQAPTKEPTAAPTDVPEEATPSPTSTPEPTPTPEPVSIKANAKVSSTVLNVRVGPGTNYAIMKLDNKEVKIYLDDEMEVLGVSGDFYHIYFIYNGEKYEGYVYRPYVTLNKGVTIR